jgi:simple sugar transport system ATP-binding protein
VLTPGEADEVLGLLRRMATEGQVSVLIITHKFREVMSFADEVTVLRRGRLAGHGLVKDLTPAAMAEMMVGARADTATAPRAPGKAGEPRLRVVQLEADDDLGTPALRQMRFDVCAGEIVGMAGVAGNGQEELVEVLAGQRAARSGSLSVSGKLYRAKRDEMRGLKVRCLPDEPLRNACVGAMSVAENIGFRGFDRHPFTRLGALVSGGALRKAARSLIAEYGIRTPGPDAAISSLSGGNVQRAVLARELKDDVALLIASNPCFGLDFAAVAEIRTRIMAARNAGAAVLLISADLDEIFALSDRIVVMSEGRLVHETPVESADLGLIGRHMAGHSAEA